MGMILYLTSSIFKKIPEYMQPQIEGQENGLKNVGKSRAFIFSSGIFFLVVNHERHLSGYYIGY